MEKNSPKKQFLEVSLNSRNMRNEYVAAPDNFITTTQFANNWHQNRALKLAGTIKQTNRVNQYAEIMKLKPQIKNERDL